MCALWLDKVRYLIDFVITWTRSAAFYNKRYNHVVVVSAHLLILVCRIKCPTLVKQSKLFIVFVLTFMAHQMQGVDQMRTRSGEVSFNHIKANVAASGAL